MSIPEWAQLIKGLSVETRTRQSFRQARRLLQKYGKLSFDSESRAIPIKFGNEASRQSLPELIMADSGASDHLTSPDELAELPGLIIDIPPIGAKTAKGIAIIDKAS